MANNHTEVYVEALPKCDFCDRQARYDARTNFGPWAYLCEFHFGIYGLGLGLGKGQKLKIKGGESKCRQDAK